MKLKEIHRTSTFAWSPAASLPLLATGTVAGALDESFSDESYLEIWAPDFLDKDEFDLGGAGNHGPKGVVTDTARFNRLAWGYVGGPSRPQGVIAAGLENGELALWDPAKIVAGADISESLILRNTTHKGPVRGLDFNPIQKNLLASGGIDGEVYIWDLKDPSKPYTPTPGARSNKLDEITSVAWNQQVQYILAGASSTGYTVVWDLRGKREVVALAYGGGAGTLAGQVGSGTGMAVGGRRGMSDIAWHPDNATRVVTASEDDSSPVIMVWDLRNARAPEKILTGHEKGVLSLSWCKQDADLLLSCGKDNRALCWNPQTSEIIGELPSAENWAFQVDWCPRNPDLLATAFFDGTIGIHSIQSTNDPSTTTSSAINASSGADIFDLPPQSHPQTGGGTLSLKQPPKWLRRPSSASFGFGGTLVTVSNLSAANGKTQSSVVHLRKVVTEQGLVERAKELVNAMSAPQEGESKDIESFAESRTKELTNNREGWKALLSLFKANSREELVTLLGFSKAEIAQRIAQAVENLKTAAAEKKTAEAQNANEEMDMSEFEERETVVSFAEPERDEGIDNAGVEKTPSEVSGTASITTESDITTSIAVADSESTNTVPSLFGDDDDAGDEPGTPQHDFFSTISAAHQAGGQGMQIPHTNYGLDSSVAATIGSGPSSVTSETIKNNTFKIYPADESDTDRLVTKALVLGDFESAVALCLSSDRFADAILLAVRGGPELLQKTQKAYFERRTTQLPYLRLFQSIVTNDLDDIVQNADLQEWQEIFVVLCTFASKEEFPGLAEQLGNRLEFQFALAGDTDSPEEKARAGVFRKNATLTYLAAARLERLVNIWIDEMKEEEEDTIKDDKLIGSSYYSAHAHALQSFVEKVTVFRAATKYTDEDLSQTSTSTETESARTYKLGSLYDRYYEYADILATQGLVKEAVKFVKLTPSGYQATRTTPLETFATTAPTPPSYSAPAAPTQSYNATAQSYSQAPYQQPQQPHQHQPAAAIPATHGYNAPVQPTHGYNAPVQGYSQAPYQPTSLTQPPHLRQPAQSAAAVPPPPRVGARTPAGGAPLPPPKRQENGGWNDAPVVNAAGRTGPAGSLSLNKPAAITSPFPNATPSPGFSPTGSPYQSSAGPLPPPPRPGSRPGSVQPNIPPPPQGHRMQGPPQPGGGMYPPHVRPPSSSALQQQMAPPARLMSPPQQIPQRQPTPPQYAPPPGAASKPHEQGPSGPYGRGPQPGQGQAPGQYAAPQFSSGPRQPMQQQPMQQHPQQHMQQQQQQQQHPQHMQQQQPGPYGPPQGLQRPSSSQPPQPGGPPPPGGPGGPPRAASSAARVRAPPPPPKYPIGDRSHIPESSRPAYNIITEHLNRMKQTTPPQQKRLVDDLERRINPLFDALNCESLSKTVVDQLLVLCRAMEAHDRPAALAIHVNLLTQGSQTDDIGLWMSGLKQLIMRM